MIKEDLSAGPAALNEINLIVPFLKWAGGKRWLTRLDLDLFPQKYNRYIEPFIGGGTVFFFLNPTNALIADINLDLIDTYKALKTDYRLVERYLKEHHRRHGKRYYYKIRSSAPRSIFTKAAKFIYLNRTCWNGLYRVNLDGEFNVPLGTKTNVIMDSDNFQDIAKRLKSTAIKKQDFEVTINQAAKDDFVFVDPPYTVKHNHNGFIKYNENLFSWEDQERLKRSIDVAVQRGAKVLVLNAAHESIESLYQEYSQQYLSRHSVLAARPEFRGRIKELVIKCGYE